MTAKDKDGNVLGTPFSGNGPASATVALPAGTATIDISVTRTGPGSGPLAAYNWTVNCTSNLLDDVSLHGFTWEVVSDAGSEAEAWSDFEAVEAAGPGGMVPPGVLVNKWVDVQPGPSVTTVTSALHDSFASYVITVNGSVVADLASGTNAVLQALGNGWYQVTSSLPNSLVGTDATVLLTQQGQAPGAVTSRIEVIHL